jgi:DNA-binding transcriptional regulator YhcF (GntR family)
MLEHFFGSRTRVKLLNLFFSEPDKSFYVRELARRIQVQLNAVRRELANLEKIGVIGKVDLIQSKEIRGTERSKFYQLKSDFILLEELQTFLNKSQLLEQKVYLDRIKNHGGMITLLVLTGFFVHNDKAPTDMLLVGNIKVDLIDEVLRDFEKFLDQPIRYTVMNDKEFTDRKDLGDVFLYSILDERHIKVVNTLK